MQISIVENSSPVRRSLSYDDQRRIELFLKDQIPTWFAIGGYFALATVSTAVLPHIFHQLKWYYGIVIYIIAPSLVFCNAYGSGLTDCSFSHHYEHLAIFTIGTWARESQGGILAGLAGCGAIVITYTSTDLMQDFKTGYLTLASPCSIFVSHTAVDMCVGSLIHYLWQKKNEGNADAFKPAIASGLICGDGMWT
ncbi:probable metal-nicotianamine transporter YSL7 isoform X1 [Olea europaea subsp. europaea]|uniref:Probable metal-nicotianamine transporter YSL7 isoform X1 n=1 Tax=Olea europaea subsp. europaea TaxID=158383 RepID=A0A8S0RF74_OLEEU|nr:probable metal-nicotianamine transporter YSL7 isoform X1 [Olea europaea subsp. europaea]